MSVGFLRSWHSILPATFKGGTSYDDVHVLETAVQICTAATELEAFTAGRDIGRNTMGGVHVSYFSASCYIRVSIEFMHLHGKKLLSYFG